MPDYAVCLAAFIAALGLERPHVVGLSFGGALALQLFDRHPTIPATLVLAGAYAGWAGSLPPDVVEDRLRQSLELADLPPDVLVRTLISTMFSASGSTELVAEFAASVAGFHPAGFRAMARSSAEADLRAVLPRIDIPTLLLYGDKDVRAPLSVAADLHAAIRSSRLVVMAGVGHVSSVEAGTRFNDHVRSFIRESQSQPVSHKQSDS